MYIRTMVVKRLRAKRSPRGLRLRPVITEFSYLLISIELERNKIFLLFFLADSEDTTGVKLFTPGSQHIGILQETILKIV